MGHGLVRGIFRRGLNSILNMKKIKTDQMKQFIKTASMLLFVGFTLSSCATVADSDASQNRRMLSKAGFQKQTADTPEKLAHIKSMKQNQVISHRKKGKNYFAYADADSKSLYMGTEANYRKYENLSIPENNAEKLHDEAVTSAYQMNQDAANDWGAWGGWGGFTGGLDGDGFGLNDEMGGAIDGENGMGPIE